MRSLSQIDGDVGEPPQLVVQQFSMEALHHIMTQNKSQMLGLYDEMTVMYGQLDAYKHSAWVNSGSLDTPRPVQWWIMVPQFQEQEWSI